VWGCGEIGAFGGQGFAGLAHPNLNSSTHCSRKFAWPSWLESPGGELASPREFAFGLCHVIVRIEVSRRQISQSLVPGQHSKAPLLA